MARLLSQTWKPDFEGLSRRDRRGGFYDSYLPDPLRGWGLSFTGDLAADIADAEQAVRDLNASEVAHDGLEGLARVLLRTEAVASSRIEGLAVGPRRLLRAEALLPSGEPLGDRRAVEIVGNIRAMDAAIALGSGQQDFTLHNLLAVHRLIMEGSHRPDLGGSLRISQNWIGGSNYNPLRAAFVPPPPEYVPDLVDDLIEYLNEDLHSPLVQAGIAHAQFETIHPFADGNGRTGRALIHVALRRRGLAPNFVPPVSLVLATFADDYIGGLTAYRHVSPSDSPARSEAAHTWLRTFAFATRRACLYARRYASEIAALQDGWQERSGRTRRDSSARLLLAALPGAPVLSVKAAASLIGRSTVNTNAAVNRLVEAGVLAQRNIGKQRYRIFEAPEVIDLITRMEQAFTSPDPDIHNSDIENPQGRPQ